MNRTSKTVVAPCLPGIQLLTPGIFSTLAAMVFKSMAQVTPLTLTKIAFDSWLGEAAESDWADN